MRTIFQLFFLIFLSTNLIGNESIHFSQAQNAEMEAFERRIAYFFNAEDQEPIANGYIQALQELEVLGADAPIELLKERLLPPLEEAYQSIKEQRNLHFDVPTAAKNELSMILAQTHGASYENLQKGMECLYQHIFQSDSPKIRKAAHLRTFLYLYKLDTQKKKNFLPQEDREIMIQISDYSQKLLNEVQEEL